jgi:hypothetical protein
VNLIPGLDVERCVHLPRRSSWDFLSTSFDIRVRLAERTREASWPNYYLFCQVACGRLRTHPTGIVVGTFPGTVVEPPGRHLLPASCLANPRAQDREEQAKQALCPKRCWALPKQNRSWTSQQRGHWDWRKMVCGGRGRQTCRRVGLEEEKFATKERWGRRSRSRFSSTRVWWQPLTPWQRTRWWAIPSSVISCNIRSFRLINGLTTC